jgi:hypothetical protein
VISDNHQALIDIGIVPFPQRGNHALAVNSPKGPHVEQDHLAAQIYQA